MSLPIYLDYAASSPLDPRVAEVMAQCLHADNLFGNPSSAHQYGQLASQVIEQAREQVASVIHAKPQQIIWTSGATEANNLAIKGLAQFYKDRGKHIITSITEHESVIDTCNVLAKEGFEITFLTPNSTGIIPVETIAKNLRKDTFLISIMHVNNETGVMQDLAAIGNLARQNNLLFHVDAAQSVGKIAIDLTQLPVDLMSLSAHKIYGPKGVGALFVRESSQMKLQALLHGGGQENNLRPGTLATHQIVGMGKALQIAAESMLKDAAHIVHLRSKFFMGMKKLGGIELNGTYDQSIPGILNVAFENISATQLIAAIKNVAVSTGSACHASSPTPSRVLQAMGLSAERARSSIRFSIGRFTTEEQIDVVLEKLKHVIGLLRPN